MLSKMSHMFSVRHRSLAAFFWRWTRRKCPTPRYVMWPDAFYNTGLLIFASGDLTVSESMISLIWNACQTNQGDVL